MAPTIQYDRLLTATEEEKDFAPKSDDDITVPVRRITGYRLLGCGILIFLCGVMLGAAAILPLHGSLSSPSHQEATSELGWLGENVTSNPLDVQDVNEYFGLVFQPGGEDPVCGTNRHEAQQNGCHYDVMASRWYPDECFHGDILEQFLGEVDFDWYWDPSHTSVATWETAKAGDYDKLYPLEAFHIMHCLYQFRRLHMAFIEHRQIDDDVFSYGHTLHCTRLIMQWPMEWRYGKNTTTQSPSGVSYCIPAFL